MAIWSYHSVGLMRTYRATTGGFNTRRTIESRSELAWNTFELRKQRKKKQILTSHDTHKTEKTETTDFSALHLHSSVLFVWVEGGVVQAVEDFVFLHPVLTPVTQVLCSPLGVDCRHRGLIPKVHLQPLVFIVCSGHPRAHSHVGAAEVQPGVRGPKIFPSFWWGGDLAVRDSSVLHTEWFGAFWGKAQKWKGLS